METTTERKHRQNVLERLNGRCYFAYRPANLSRSTFARSVEFVKAFENLDKRLMITGPTVTEVEFVRMGTEALVPLVGSGEGKRNVDPRYTAAAALSLACKDQPRAQDLLHVNSQVIGGGNTLVRQGPMWVGAAHPSDAWYVAPEARFVHCLLKNLLHFVADRNLPTTLRASVGLLQLLQVHPFLDGNGRTARALFLATLIREFGRKGNLFSVLCHLWEFQGMRLHAASLVLRDGGGWGDYLELIRNAFDRSLQTNRLDGCAESYVSPQ